MRKKILWVAAALVLIAIPAVIGLVTLREDNSRRAGALVTPGQTGTEYQLLLTQALVGTPEIKDAIAVDSFSWSVENPTTIGSATGGAGAGKVEFNEFEITKKVDNASPVLFKQLASGAHYKKAVLTLRKAGDGKPYMTYTMETVFVTKIDNSGEPPEAPDEHVTFVFGKLVVQSDGQNPNGTTTKAVAGWNQVTNKSDDVVTP